MIVVPTSNDDVPICSIAMLNYQLKYLLDAGIQPQAHPLDDQGLDGEVRIAFN